jgi:hypothetical protein
MTAFFAALLYLATAVVVVGLAYRIWDYARTPAPLKIPTTPAPVTRGGVALRLLREVALFESLFRSNLWTWAFGWIFHVGLALVLVLGLGRVDAGLIFVMMREVFLQTAQSRGFGISRNVVVLEAPREGVHVPGNRAGRAIEPGRARALIGHVIEPALELPGKRLLGKYLGDAAGMHVDHAAGLRFVAVTDGDVLDDEIGGRRAGRRLDRRNLRRHLHGEQVARVLDDDVAIEPHRASEVAAEPGAPRGCVHALALVGPHAERLDGRDTLLEDRQRAALRRHQGEGRPQAMSGGKGGIGLERLVDRGERVDEIGGRQVQRPFVMFERSAVAGRNGKSAAVVQCHGVLLACRLVPARMSRSSAWVGKVRRDRERAVSVGVKRT